MRTVEETENPVQLHCGTPAESNDKLRLALSAAGTGVWQWDRQTGAFQCDESFARLFDFAQPLNEISAKTILRRMDRSDRRRVLDSLRSLTERAHPWIDEIRIKASSGQIRWISMKGVPLIAGDGSVNGFIGVAHDVTESKRTTAHTEALLREVTHRSKNMLALILAMARLTAREATDIDSHLKDFSLRVAGLSASQDLIVAAEWQSVDLGSLAVSEVQAIARDRASRVSITGPSFLVTPEAAQTLGMILTELTLNALQHGALSVPDGHVRLTWQIRDNGEVEMIWKETGGGGFDPKQPKGYGMAAVERFSIQGLKVSASFSASDRGFTWTLAGRVESLGSKPQAHRT